MEERARNKHLIFVLLVFFIIGLVLLIIISNIGPLKYTSSELPYDWESNPMELSGDGNKVIRNGVALFSNNSIWIMNSDGLNQTKVIGFDDGLLAEMAISKNGSKVAYSIDYYSHGELEYSELWVIDGNGENNTIIASLEVFNKNKIMDLAFSNDEMYLLFLVYNNYGAHTSGSTIYSVNLENKNISEILKSNSELIQSAKFSPNGEMICFSRDSGIYVMEIDGSNISRVRKPPYGILHWYSYDSPTLDLDNKKIAFVQTKQFLTAGRKYEIFIMNVDGSGKIRIFKTGYEWGEPIRSLNFNLEENEVTFLYKSTVYKMEYDEGRLTLISYLKILSYIVIIIGIIGLIVLRFKSFKSRVCGEGRRRATRPGEDEGRS